MNPVVWRWPVKDRGIQHFTITQDDAKAKAAIRRGEAVEPLYAHPPHSSIPTVTGWQPIETAPKDGTEIIIGHDKKGWRTVARWLDDGEGFFEVNNDPSDSWGWGSMMPTHWQPLPSPPAL